MTCWGLVWIVKSKLMMALSSCYALCVAGINISLPSAGYGRFSSSMIAPVQLNVIYCRCIANALAWPKTFEKPTAVLACCCCKFLISLYYWMAFCFAVCFSAYGSDCTNDPSAIFLGIILSVFRIKPCLRIHLQKSKARNYFIVCYYCKSKFGRLAQVEFLHTEGVMLVQIQHAHHRNLKAAPGLLLVLSYSND